MKITLTLFLLSAVLPAYPQMGDWLNSMQQATALEQTGDVQAAIVSLRAAVKAAEADAAIHPRSLPASLNRLGHDWQMIGRYNDGIAACERALRIIEAGQGRENSDYATTLANVAAAYIRSGDPLHGETLAREALAIHERVGASDAEPAAVARSVFAQALLALNRWQDAAPIVERELAVFEAHDATGHLPMALNNLAVIRGLQGRHEDALHLLERALALMETQPGNPSPLLVEPLNNLATTWVKLDNLTAAEDCYKRAIAIAETKHLTNTRVYPEVLANYAELLRREGRKRESSQLKELARQAAAESRRTSGAGMIVSASSLRAAK